MSRSLINTGITFFDADSRGGNATAVVNASRGLITFTAGTTGVTGPASTGSLGGAGAIAPTFTGTIAQLNTFFRGTAGTPGTLVFSSSTTGTVNFSIVTTDEDGLITTTPFVGDVEPVTAPVVTVPGGTLSVNTGQNKSLEGLGFGVTNTFDSGGYATLVMVASHGTLTANPADSGATIVSGNGSSTLTLTGTIPSLNEFLTSPGSSTLTYLSSTTGAETITTTVTNASGLSNTPIVQNLSLGQVPVVTPPAGFLAAVQNVNLAINGTGFSIADSDASGSQTVHLIVTGAGTRTITVAIGGGSTGVSVANNISTNVTLTGTLAKINILLASTGADGTITFIDNTVENITFTVQDTDDTSRVGSGSVSVMVVTSTPTWSGYAVAFPSPLPSTSISDFVVPIDLSILPAGWWAAVTPDGRDIRVTINGAANTLVPRHLLHFNYAAKTGILFAKTGNATISPEIRIWAGATLAPAPASGDTYGQFNTYPSYIRGWWPDGGGTDSTSYVKSFTGGVIGDRTTPFGLGSDGSTARETAHASLPAAPETLCFFAKPTNLTGTWGGLYSFRDGGTGYSHVCRMINSNVVSESNDNNTSVTRRATAIGLLTSGAWQFFSGSTLADNSRIAYRDGSNTASNTQNVTFGSSGAGNFYRFTSFPGDVGLIFVLSNISNSLVPDYLANYAGAYNQPTYWGSWTYVPLVTTGL